jgi:hypothetical protein
MSQEVLSEKYSILPTILSQMGYVIEVLVTQSTGHKNVDWAVPFPTRTRHDPVIVSSFKTL